MTPWLPTRGIVSRSSRTFASKTPISSTFRIVTPSGRNTNASVVRNSRSGSFQNTIRCCSSSNSRARAVSIRELSVVIGHWSSRESIGLLQLAAFAFLEVAGFDSFRPCVSSWRMQLAQRRQSKRKTEVFPQERSGVLASVRHQLAEQAENAAACLNKSRTIETPQTVRAAEREFVPQGSGDVRSPGSIGQVPEPVESRFPAAAKRVPRREPVPPQHTIEAVRSVSVLLASFYLLGLVVLIWAPETKDQALPTEDHESN